MRNLAYLLLPLASALPAIAQDKAAASTKPTDPVEILKRADAAAKAVDSVRYVALHEDLRNVKDKFAAVQGTITLSGWAGRSPTRWLADVTVKYPEDGKVEELTAGRDVDKCFLIDKTAKKAYESTELDVAGSRRRWVELLIVNEYVHVSPLADEIDGEKIGFLGVTKVGDEECYVVHVKYKGTKQETRWFFSTKDLLARRVERYFTGTESGRGFRRLTMSSLEVNPKLPENTFKLVLPKGVTKVEGKAP